MSYSDDYLPRFFPPPKEPARGRSKREYTFADLKHFSEKADKTGRALVEYKAMINQPLPSVTATDHDDDLDGFEDETRQLIEQGREEAAKTITLFSSTLNGSCPGEEIIAAPEASLHFGLKTSVEIAADHEQGEPIDRLFGVVAFASSSEELIQAETILRRLLGSKLFKWAPAVDQFLGILSTAFGADLARLFPTSQIDDFVDGATKFAQLHFYVSKPRSAKERANQPRKKSLANLDILIDILASIDWGSTPMNDGDKVAWIRTLLGISLDVQCRDRSHFQVTIAKIIRRMADAAREIQSSWNQFCNDICAAVIGDPAVPRHHHNMGHLVSELLPIDVNSSQFAELRSMAALQCISALLGNERLNFEGGIVVSMVNLLEQAKESRLLSEAYPLSSILSLAQCALTPAAVRSASVEDVTRLVEIFDAIKCRFSAAYGSARSESLGVSLLDGARIRDMISVIVDGQLGPYRPQSELFRIIDNAIKEEDDTFDEGDLDGGSGKEDKKETGDEGDACEDDDE